MNMIFRSSLLLLFVPSTWAVDAQPQMVAVTCDIDDDAPPGNEIVHIDGTTGKLTTIQRNFTAWATNSGDIGYSGGASNRTSTLYMATRENPRTERLTMVGYSASTAAVVSTSPGSPRP